MSQNPKDTTEGQFSTFYRRTLIRTSATVLPLGIAGCVSQDPGNDDNSTSTEESTSTSSTTSTSSPTKTFEQVNADSTTETTGGVTTITGNVVLDEGQFTQHELRLEHRSLIELSGAIEGGAGLDILLFQGERSFANYQNGEGDVSSSEVVATGVNEIERELVESSGDYFLVFDNSDVYGEDSTGRIELEFQITARGITDDPGSEEYSPSQPKIFEVTDNFGHEIAISAEDPPSKDVSIDDELVVSEDTVIDLCVTEVAKTDEDTITYSFDFLNDAEHPDNPESADARIESNCWEWDMRREDYQSRWGFRIWIRNQDNIYYQNNSVESDFSVDVYYTNLTLEE